MRVLITGTSRGIGLAITEKFLAEGHTVIGIDRLPASVEHPGYTHITADVRDYKTLPDIEGVDILINNAGTQCEEDIDVNLRALIGVTERYGVREGIHAILNIGSASGHTGSEFPEYAASKGGVLSYTKNVAMRVAPFGATCNSLDPGGVITPMNAPVLNNPALFEKIMAETPLRRWAEASEIADWAYFLTVTNRFCTGQNILVDGGEAINYKFIWE